LRVCFCELFLPGAQIVALADLDAVVAQDVVGGRDVEIEIRHRMAEQELQALVAGFLVASLDHDLLVFGAVDLLRGDGLDEGDCLGDAGLEVGQSLFVVLVYRNLYSSQRATTPLAVSQAIWTSWSGACREQAMSGRHRGIDFLGVDMGLRLVEVFEGCRGIDEARNSA
jgi:hypothetical protein